MRTDSLDVTEVPAEEKLVGEYRQGSGPGPGVSGGDGLRLCVPADPAFGGRLPFEFGNDAGGRFQECLAETPPGRSVVGGDEMFQVREGNCFLLHFDFTPLVGYDGGQNVCMMCHN